MRWKESIKKEREEEDGKSFVFSLNYFIYFFRPSTHSHGNSYDDNVDSVMNITVKKSVDR